jgi:hypothetical protein
MIDEEYWKEARLQVVLSGHSAYCYTQQACNELVEKLQTYSNHKGVVISGMTPWCVSIIGRTLTQYDLISPWSDNKFYKCVKGKYKGEIIYNANDDYMSVLSTKYKEEDEYDIDDCEFIEITPNWKEV